MPSLVNIGNNAGEAAPGDKALINPAPAANGVGTADLWKDNIDVVVVTANAGTCSAAFKSSNFTNSSAAAMTITIATTGATDGQFKILRIWDFSAVAKGLTFVNTENSSITAPANSNGSTTLPLTVGLMFNGQTSKWRFIAVA